MNEKKLKHSDLERVRKDLLIMRRVINNIAEKPLSLYSAEYYAIVFMAFNSICEGNADRIAQKYGVDYFGAHFKAMELLNKAEKVNVAQGIKEKQDGEDKSVDEIRS